jgi:hypothetical protein
MTDQISAADYRVALGSINLDATNYQVFTPYIAFVFLFGVATLVATIIYVQIDDQTIPQGTYLIISVLDGVILVLLFLAYLSYLRNIGRYVYGRIRPIDFVNPSTCK